MFKNLCVLNGFQTGHGCCADMMYKWRLLNSLTCDNGNKRKTVNYIITECGLRKFNQEIKGIHEIIPKAIK